MASTLAMGVVGVAVIDRLRATQVLASKVTSEDGTVRIVDDVPQAWLRTPDAYVPYIVVESGTEVPFNTMGAASAAKWGSVTGPQIRIVSQSRGEAEVTGLMNLVKQALDGQPLTVPGYASVIVECASTTMLKDVLAGKVTRELVGQFDVTVHQS